MLMALPVTILLTTATALLGVSATHNRTAGFHQTTRDEVVQRTTRTSSRVRRAATPTSAAPATLDRYFHQFYSGSGYTETDDNPNNYDVPNNGAGPMTTTFPGTQSTPTAIRSCADYALNQFYYAFQIYYLNSQDVWTCRIYYEYTNRDPYLSDPSYFNVPNSDADPVFGYQTPTNY